MPLFPGYGKICFNCFLDKFNRVKHDGNGPIPKNCSSCYAFYPAQLAAKGTYYDLLDLEDFVHHTGNLSCAIGNNDNRYWGGISEVR